MSLSDVLLRTMVSRARLAPLLDDFVDDAAAVSKLQVGIDAEVRRRAVAFGVEEVQRVDVTGLDFQAGGLDVELYRLRLG